MKSTLSVSAVAILVGRKEGRVGLTVKLHAHWLKVFATTAITI